MHKIAHGIAVAIFWWSTSTGVEITIIVIFEENEYNIQPFSYLIEFIITLYIPLGTVGNGSQLLKSTRDSY